MSETGHERQSPVVKIQDAVRAIQEHKDDLELGHIFGIAGALRLSLAIKMLAPVAAILAGTFALGSQFSSTDPAVDHPRGAEILLTAQLLGTASTDLLKAQHSSEVTGWDQEDEIKAARRDLEDAKSAAIRAGVFQESSIQRIDSLRRSLDAEGLDIGYLRGQITSLMKELQPQAGQR